MVKFVRVGKYNPGSLTDFWPLIPRSVAVVDPSVCPYPCPCFEFVE
jgi:hypothetical protein